MEEKIVNVRNIKDATVKTHTNGFVLDFWAENTKGNSYTVKLHFDSWWVKYLANMLWKVVRNKQAEVDLLSASLKEDE